MAKPASASTGNSMTGKEALAYCTSCKMDLAGTIVAMTGDRIAKVECKTCKKTHAYKAPKGVTEPTAKPARKSKKAADNTPQANPIELEWEKLMAAHKEAPIKSYAPKSKFVLGDKIRHATFGDGIVGRLIYPNKLEVIFRTDMKILIHGGA